MLINVEEYFLMLLSMVEYSFMLVLGFILARPMALQRPLQPLQALVEARRGAGSVGPAKINPRTSIKEYSTMDNNIRKYSSTFISIREIAWI
jgi:hypothetical protein